MSSSRNPRTGRSAPVAATAALLLSAACSGSTGDGSSLVTDGTRHDAVPANAAPITLTLPADPAEPWCLRSGGDLVVWPSGSSYDVATGEVRDGSGTLLGRVGETVQGGGAVGEAPTSETLDDVDWAGCVPTDRVLHQDG